MMPNTTVAPPPDKIEDDVQRTAEHILRTQSEEEGTSLNLEPEDHRRLLESICIAIQVIFVLS